MLSADYTLDFEPGDKIVLHTREPVELEDARAERPGNYLPRDYAGEVEAVGRDAPVRWIAVRWHLPAAFGYATQTGTVSTLVHIANGVWLEARTRPRNVAATIERVSEEAYRQLIEAAS